jgi:putative membrane protein
MWFYGAPFFWIGPLIMGVVWVLVVAAIFYGISRAVGMRPPAVVDRDDPLAILERRYARGEISREEFLQMREDLRRERP